MTPIPDLLRTIGNTPLVELRRLKPAGGARILAKLEGHNPGGSVKDRPALWMVQEAEQNLFFVGMSSGAAVCGAIQVAAGMKPSDTVVVLLPDRGDRYLSTNLFRSICAECPP